MANILQQKNPMPFLASAEMDCQTLTTNAGGTGDIMAPIPCL